MSLLPADVKVSSTSGLFPGYFFARRTQPFFHRIALVLLLLSLICPTVLQAAPTFPELTGRVVDRAALLPPAKLAELTQVLEEHEQATGNQVVVVTVKTLQSYPIEDYANQLGRHWGIGQADKNNGVILLVAPKERKVRIEVGYGLEGALTDALSSDIIRSKILPQFREDDYPGGIRRGVDNILKAIKGEYTVDPQSIKNKPGKRLTDHFPLIFIAFIALTEILKRFGFQKIGNSAFPSAIAGILATVITTKLWIGIGVALAIFFCMYWFVKPENYSGGRRNNPNERTDRNIGGSGRSGGGFSGGGGSFGGGGASGGW